MASWPEDLTQRREAFAERYGVPLVGQIGFGFDGNVFETDRKSAVKFLKDRAAWQAEKQEQFEEHWPELQAILWAFQQCGIDLGDVNPRNIRLTE